MANKKVVGVVLTDTHLHANNIEEQHSIYDQVIELALKHKCNVYHGGDIFDSRKSQPLSVLIAFGRVLDKFSEAGVVLNAIPGNHDKTDYDAVESYLDCFTGRMFFKLIREYSSINLHDGVVLHMLPFFSENGSYRTRLKEIRAEQGAVNLLLTHVAVNGVKNNDGSTIDNDLNRAAFKKFDEILVGHYHDQSRIHNIQYIGAAFQHNYGEKYEDKGFTLIYEDGSTKFVPSAFKPYMTWKINIEEINDALMVELEQNAEKTVEDAYLRIKFYGKEKDLIQIPKGNLEDLGVDIKLIANEVVESIGQAEDNSFNSWDNESIEAELKAFVKAEQLESLYDTAVNYLKTKE